MRALAFGLLVGLALAHASRWAEVRYALANLDARYEELCCGCSAFNDED